MEFEKINPNLFHILQNNNIIGKIVVNRHSLTNTIDYYGISYETAVFGYGFGAVAKNLKDAKQRAEINYNKMQKHLKNYTYFDTNSNQWFRNFAEFERSAYNKK